MLTVFCIEKLVHRGKGRVGMHAVVGAAVPVIAWDTCLEQSMCVQVAGGCVQRAKADAVAQKDQVDHHVTLEMLDRRARCTSEIIVGAMTAAEWRSQSQHNVEDRLAPPNFVGACAPVVDGLLSGLQARHVDIQSRPVQASLALLALHRPRATRRAGR